MLHVTTEIGKSGKQEREKRHFAYLHNKPSEPKYVVRSRKYIPHGYGVDFEFRPHPQHKEPKYTNIGLDWTSHIRYIPAPQKVDGSVEIWPDHWKGMRTFPWMTQRTTEEWKHHPEANSDAKRCEFDGVHKATSVSMAEITHSQLLGKNRLVLERRNNIPLASPGDKSYQVVEYSPSFHKLGSTRPIVNFSGNVKYRTDTFVPLQELPQIPRESYQDKEKQRLELQEVSAVKELESWCPSPPLQPVGHTHPLPIARKDTIEAPE